MRLPDALDGDTSVYGTPEHPHWYLAEIDGDWLMWPAERGGWQYRRPTRPPDAEHLYELEPPFAAFAIRASGADRP